VETESVETESVETESVETESVETESVETESVETESVETEPGETESGEAEPGEGSSRASESRRGGPDEEVSAPRSSGLVRSSAPVPIRRLSSVGARPPTELGGRGSSIPEEAVRSGAGPDRAIASCTRPLLLRGPRRNSHRGRRHRRRWRRHPANPANPANPALPRWRRPRWEDAPDQPIPRADPGRGSPSPPCFSPAPVAAPRGSRGCPDS
jgi:hypothetical protein